MSNIYVELCVEIAHVFVKKIGTRAYPVSSFFDGTATHTMVACYGPIRRLDLSGYLEVGHSASGGWTPIQQVATKSKDDDDVFCPDTECPPAVIVRT